MPAVSHPRSFAFALSLFCFACGSPSSPVDAGIDAGTVIDCDDIIAACHSVDVGTGEIHECHENAEGTWSGAECASNKARCKTLCANAPPKDGG